MTTLESGLKEARRRTPFVLIHRTAIVREAFNYVRPSLINQIPFEYLRHGRANNPHGRPISWHYSHAVATPSTSTRRPDRPTRRRRGRSEAGHGGPAAIATSARTPAGPVPE